MRKIEERKGGKKMREREERAEREKFRNFPRIRALPRGREEELFFQLGGQATAHWGKLPWRGQREGS